MLNESGEVYIAHKGNTQKVVNTLQSAGLIVEWDGSEHSRLLVKAA